MKAQRVVITGGPGAGKTTLLAAFESRGYACMPDSARAIIRHRKNRGLSPRPPLREFAEEILRLDIECYRYAESAEGYVFFDRGIPDALCMLDELGVLSPSGATRHVSTYRYFRVAFLLPPWQEIFCTDDERDQSFMDATRVYDRVRDWYVRCGYDVVPVPCSPVAERAEFLLDTLATDPSPQA
jgi:predicted ATPase